MLEFIIAKTYGIESKSIKQTVEIINKNVSVYIGPQETCIHEAKVAAAVNKPMVSYVSKIKCFISIGGEWGGGLKTFGYTRMKHFMTSLYVPDLRGRQSTHGTVSSQRQSLPIVFACAAMIFRS